MLRTDVPTINMDGNSWCSGTVVDLVDIPCWRINMTDVTRMRDHKRNPLETVINNSKTALLFLTLILPNDSPRTMIMNRRTLARIPNERYDRKGVIGRPIKKVLCIRLGVNCTTVFLLQPIALGNKTTEQRLDCKNRMFRFLHMPNHCSGRVNKIR